MGLPSWAPGQAIACRVKSRTEGCLLAGTAQGKQFFFEKQNQKTSAVDSCTAVRRVVSVIRDEPLEAFCFS